ncbi:hypothetical protein [Argonema galeatum]|uniref:hypothetical protein n=1 Tax=Argonema galeatum TaxID=2942762 RepID=UPI002011D8F3|nr:hypothetical protein [Argonema galeatum]MCL1463436.1 hypothetical protein [Argonema galeatum A003/A1]
MTYTVLGSIAALIADISICDRSQSGSGKLSMNRVIAIAFCSQLQLPLLSFFFYNVAQEILTLVLIFCRSQTRY